MYTLIGTYADGSKCKPLSFPTLPEALKRLQDLIEADECEIAYGDTEARGINMFVRYTIVPQHVAETAKCSPTPTSDPDGPNTPPPLRLVR